MSGCGAAPGQRESGRTRPGLCQGAPSMQQDGTWRQLVAWQADLRLNQYLGQKEAAEEPWEVGG